jgi:hypothetical protein
MDVATGIRRAGRGIVRAGAMATADLRPDPDLIVIGVKRGGTTSLFRDLERHPAMCPLVPSARRLPMMRENMKGVHYFDSDLHRSLRWYRSHFPTSISRAWRARSAGASFAAEASPYYFFHPLAAERACDALAHTVFVVMLRDPVERTISHWAEQTRNGVETLTLADAVDAEADRVGDDGEHLDALGSSHAHEQQTYVAQSLYADSHARWVRAAGDDRLITLFSEDYYRDPAGVVDVITGALGLAPTAAGATVHRNAAPRPAPIDSDLEAQLVERFRPDVERLADRLGRRPPWPRFAR